MTLSRRAFGIALGGAAAAGLTGCISTNKATGRTSFTGTLTPEAEVELGDGEHPKLLNAFGGEYDDRKLAKYVRNVGKKLARHTEYQYPYRFTLLNSPIVNAFALPGGNVYISRGLMALASNEAEMAGVLAHELGHVNARHSAERYGAQQATALGIGGARILAALFLDVSQDLLNTGTQLAQGVAGLALQAYSRKQEFEADTLGVRYMSKQGYDPDAMVTFLATLREQSILDARARGLPDGAVDEHNMMATHPRTIDRVRAAMEQADTQRTNKAVVNRDQYLAQIDGMIFGDDPAQGLIDGQAFIHPGLRFKFEVPPGFRLQNSPQRVVASDGKGAAIVFDIGGTKTPKNLRAYVANQWAENAQVRGVEAIKVNGARAATGATVAQVDGNQADARLVAIERNGDSVFRLMFLSPRGRTRELEKPFRRTTYSFKRLSARDAKKIKPRRLRIQKAKGRSISQLSKRLPYGKQNPEWFKVMNDLPDNAKSPGAKTLKVVI